MTRAWWRSDPRIADATVQPLIGDGEIYGFEIVCEFLTGGGGVETKKFRSKGKSEAKARRVPMFKRRFVRIIELEPYTREQWLRCFGEGRM